MSRGKPPGGVLLVHPKAGDWCRCRLGNGWRSGYVVDVKDGGETVVVQWPGAPTMAGRSRLRCRAASQIYEPAR